MDQYLTLAHQLLPADLWNKAVMAAGYLAIVGQVVPWLLTRGVVLAAQAADWLAKDALNSPLRPLILWQAPAIVKFLDALTTALEKVLDTFKSRLEADIEAAETAPAPPPAAAPAAAPNAAPAPKP